MIPIAKPLIGREEVDAVDAVLESGMLIQGRKVAEFEEAFSSFCGAKFGVATTNGTQALLNALQAAKVTGEVLVPAFTHVSSATSVLGAGAKPVFVDIDPRTYCMDPEDLRRKITGESQAVIPVHLYGQCAEMDAITEIAKERDLVVIEDACQAHGAEFKGKKAGSLGDMACFSFYATKNMTCGEGGMVTTSNEEYADEMRRFRSQGQAKKYEHVSLGFNYRMTEMQAAIGIEQLKKLPAFTEKRRAYAALYGELLPEGVAPFESPDCRHVYHQYTVSVERRDALQALLKEKGIGNGIHYRVPAHEQPVLSEFKSGLPKTDEAAERVLSIPVNPAISEEDVRLVAETINSFLE